jgi:uncharacterized protein YcfJ
LHGTARDAPLGADTIKPVLKSGRARCRRDINVQHQYPRQANYPD